MRLLSLPLLAALLGLPFVTGCGGSSTDNGTAGDGPIIKEIPAKNLLAAEFETPDLDGGKVKVPTPKGWKIGDRQGGVLIRFYTDDSSGLPRLLVFTDASPYTGVDTATEENILDLADQMQAELDQKHKETERTQYREPCKALLIGDNAWVRYVAAGKWKGHGVERVFLKTVVNKKLYTVELNVMTGKIGDFQKGAYSVAGRMVFNAKNGTPPAAPAFTPEDAKPATEEKTSGE